jgi:hypothetical protein
MDGPMLIVRTAEDLDRLLSADRRRVRRLALALESLNPEDQASWERRLNRHYRACGCEGGAVALVVTLLGASVLAFRYHDLLGEHPFVAGGGILLALLIATGLGKAVGLAIARRRLEGAVVSLRRRLAAA